MLLFVGALGTLSPSSHAHSTNTPVPPDAAFVHIHTNEAMAEVTLEPGRIGQANATIRVLRDDFSEFPAKDVQLTLEAAGSERKILRNAAHLPDGTWQVNAVDLMSRRSHVALPAGCDRRKGISTDSRALPITRALSPLLVEIADVLYSAGWLLPDRFPLERMADPSAACGDPDPAFKRTYQEIFNLNCFTPWRTIPP